MGSAYFFGHLKWVHSCSQQFFYFYSLRLGQLCHSMLVASHSFFRLRVCSIFKTRCASSFFDSVIVIILLSTKKQMVWISALREVAFMKNMKAVRDRAIMKHPRKPVSANFFRNTLLGGKNTMPKRFFFCSLPQPALSQMRHVFLNGAVLVNFFPEALNVLLGHKQKTTPPNKSVVGALGRNCRARWEMFVDSMLLGYNKAKKIVTYNLQGVNYAI